MSALPNVKRPIAEGRHKNIFVVAVFSSVLKEARSGSCSTSSPAHQRGLSRFSPRTLQTEDRRAQCDARRVPCWSWQVAALVSASHASSRYRTALCLVLPRWHEPRHPNLRTGSNSVAMASWGESYYDRLCTNLLIVPDKGRRNCLEPKVRWNISRYFQFSGFGVLQETWVPGVRKDPEFSTRQRLDFLLQGTSGKPRL
jgi:hypothetical protein